MSQKIQKNPNPYLIIYISKKQGHTPDTYQKMQKRIMAKIYKLYKYQHLDRNME